MCRGCLGYLGLGGDMNFEQQDSEIIVTDYSFSRHCDIEIGRLVQEQDEAGDGVFWHFRPSIDLFQCGQLKRISMQLSELNKD